MRAGRCIISLCLTTAFAMLAVARGSAQTGNIRFGPPGAPQTLTFADDRVRASVTYRIAPDRDYNTGPAAVTPSIARGTLTIVNHGRVNSYDLATIIPTRTDRITFETDLDHSCGAGAPLSRTGRCLVIQAVIDEKGCSTIAVLFDLSHMRAVEEVVYDPLPIEASDPHSGITPWTITGMETICTTQMMYTSPSAHSTPHAWCIRVYQTVDHRGIRRSFSVEPDPMRAISPMELPRVGSHVMLDAHNPRNYPDVYNHFVGERFMSPIAEN